MLSSEDLERLIAAKKREIENEKILLGLITSAEVTNNKEDAPKSSKSGKNTSDKIKRVSFNERVLSDRNARTENEEKSQYRRELYECEENIPPDLERYIRRYCGLPVMLKAGEYSPNNPLVRAERVAGDALLGLGEYERRRNTLRKIRQAQYREYLDQQAKKKQEAKEQAERERREREQKEKEREERERQLLLEREAYSPERRRASLSCIPVGNTFQTTKVDTGVQVDRVSRPLSVAVQTDDSEFYRISPSSCEWMTAAERELSPRAVPSVEHTHQHTDKQHTGTQHIDKQHTDTQYTDKQYTDTQHTDTQYTDKQHTHTQHTDRRRSYGDFDERKSTLSLCNRDKLVSDLRHTYMPSLFDADAIQLRNLQAEKEAAERRQFYQQELKNQIMEQQRIREERKNREKMLEQAEMRRLEEQLRMLKMAQEMEIDKQHNIDTAMKTNAKDYEAKRSELQMEIDCEQNKLLRSKSQPSRNPAKRPIVTSKSDHRSKLPFYYTHSENTFQPIEIERDRKPYSINISENSVFSKNYDVDSYLRKNLNFKETPSPEESSVKVYNDFGHQKHTIVEKALIHSPKESYYGKFTDKTPSEMSDKWNKISNTAEKRSKISETSEKRTKISDKSEKNTPTDLSDKIDRIDERISIPLLRHSPKKQSDIVEESDNLSDAMKTIDNKWKVPAVQKNILKSLPSGDGKNISILTQLGSIRRQLQLEQLRLDKLHPPNNSS